jgi:hypothetical protein
MAEIREISELRKTNQSAMLKKRNVVGVGVALKETAGQKTSDLSLTVLVHEKMAKQDISDNDMIPAAIDGIPTDVVRVGKVVAFNSHQSRHRPCPAGVSIGHYAITAGTYGAPVRDAQNNELLMLSNNHVLANSNNARIGDTILQPGAADGGKDPQDRFATLQRFVPIQYKNDPGGGGDDDNDQCAIARFISSLLNSLARASGSKTRLKPVRPQNVTNLVDAAVARPTDADYLLDDILKIGPVSGTVSAELGMAVKKSGRTTALTEGSITVLDATIDVGYGGNRVATFEHQLLTADMSNPGDSGSLLVSEDNKAVGLLFAGSDSVTVYNPIETVLSLLSITI